jgi:hypothetical protein
LRRCITLIAIILIAASTGAVGARSFESSPVTVIGHCHSAVNGGELKIIAHRFNPKAIFLAVIRRPNGKSESTPAMYVDRLGSAVVDFSCAKGLDGKPEPAGTYPVEISEYVFTGKKAIGHFTVDRKEAR